MTSNSPFNPNSLNPGATNDAIIQKLLGNAYHTVRTVSMALPDITNMLPYVEDIRTLAPSTEAMELLAPHTEVMEELAAMFTDPAQQLMYIAVVYSEIEKVVTVANSIDNVVTVSEHTDEVDIVAADLGGTWEAGSYYDFGSITQPSNGYTAAPQGHIVTVTSNMDDVVNVSSHVDNVNTVAINMDDINDVVLDLSGSWEIGALYDFGSIEEETVAFVSQPLGNIVTVAKDINNVNIVAINIADVNFLAANMSAVLDAIAGCLRPSNNLSDLTDPAQAIVNMGLSDLGSIA